jgi:hypothetical protein
MVIAQTLGVRLTMKMTYLVKFEVFLIPLIALMVAFPIFIEYLEDQTAWIISICMLLFIGNYTSPF